MMKMDYTLIKNASSWFQTEQPRRKEWYEELEEDVCSIFPSMSYQYRIGGCVLLMTIGFFLSMGSMFRLMQLVGGNPTPFAVMYTVGNLVSICSTCFLFGPYSQAKKMFAPTRFIATCSYFGFMGTCLFLAFYPNFIPLRGVWLVICILGQFIALVWYTLSYIPYGREILSNFISTCCCRGAREETLW